jgi:integrase
MKATQNNSKSKSKSSWPPIHKRKYPSGQAAYQIAYMVKGARTRETFATLKEAEDRAAQIRLMVRNEGAAGFTLAPDVRTEAAKCVEMLKPYNATITEACQHYLNRVLKYRTAPTVTEVVAKLVEEKTRSNCRERTLQDYRQRWGKFAETFGARRLSEITVEEFSEWLNSVSPSPVTRHNYRRKADELYRQAVRKKWCSENIVAATDPVQLEETEPGILDVQQCNRLLEHAPDFGMVPYLALGLFCGIRANELQRLDWAAVNLAERVVTIGAKAAKKRSQRVVTINEAALAWLLPEAKQSGPVVDRTNYRKRFDGLLRRVGFGTPGTETEKEQAAGIKLKPWPNNALRHSFGSYHLAAHGDPVRTAHEMGNSADIVHRHYKALVPQSEATRFWSLRPASEAAEKIVPIAAA